MRNSLIDRALANARAKMDAGLQTEKVASAEEALLKEAEECANALEYVALVVADDGSASGAARAEMIRDFFKKSAEAGEPVAAKSPIGIQANFGGDGSTQAKGEQGQAPSESKKKILPTGLKGGTHPEESKSRDGVMSREVMAQQPPETKKAGSVTLFDMIQSSRDASKVAADGPQQLDPQDKAPGVPTKNENVSRSSILDTAAGITNATRRQTKAPGRKRLAEIFAHANDTTGDAQARAIWPNAAAKGDIKVASAAGIAGHALGGAAIHALGGAGLGAAAGAISADKGKKGKGALRGMAMGAGGGAAAGAVGRGSLSALMHTEAGRKALLHDASSTKAIRGLVSHKPESLLGHRAHGAGKGFGGSNVHGAADLGESLFGAAGGVAGGVAAGRQATHKDYKKKEESKKESSVLLLADTWDQAITGGLGTSAQQYAEQIVARLEG